MLKGNQIKKWTGKDVINLRKVYSLTQSQLAEVLGITREQISHIENGKRIASKCVRILLTLYEIELKGGDKTR